MLLFLVGSCLGGFLYRLLSYDHVTDGVGEFEGEVDEEE